MLDGWTEAGGRVTVLLDAMVPGSRRETDVEKALSRSALKAGEGKTDGDGETFEAEFAKLLRGMKVNYPKRGS